MTEMWRVKKRHTPVQNHCSASKRALTHAGAVLSRPLKLCCGIRHRDVCSTAFKTGESRGEASENQTCLSSKSHRCMFGLTSGGIWRPYQQLKLVFVLLKTFQNILYGRTHYPAVRGHSHQELKRVCNRAEVCGTCQIIIHAGGKTQGFQKVAPSVTPPHSVTHNPAASSLIYLLWTCFYRYKVL